MKHIFVLILASTVLLLAFIQCDTYRSSASSQEQKLPKKALKAIRTADSIIAYRIDAMNDAADSAATLCGFAVKGNRIPLEAESVTALQALADSFFSCPTAGKVKKLSTFIPDAGFKFRSPKDSAMLLLDLHANLCTFHHKKKQYLIDTDSISGPLSTLLKSIFRETRGNRAEEVPVADSRLAAPNGSTPAPDAESAANAPEDEKYVRLNSALLQMITEAKAMTCYIIDPLTPGDKDAEKLDKYVILQQQQVDNAEWMQQFRQAIAGEKSFEKFDFVKNCTFLPDVAFRLCDKENTLHILFSFYCSECEMRMNGKRIFRNDCSIVQPRIIQLARQIFPKDKYIRTLQ